jgi:hypothetical protein
MRNRAKINSVVSLTRKNISCACGGEGRDNISLRLSANDKFAALALRKAHDFIYSGSPTAVFSKGGGYAPAPLTPARSYADGGAPSRAAYGCPLPIIITCPAETGSSLRRLSPLGDVLFSVVSFCFSLYQRLNKANIYSKPRGGVRGNSHSSPLKKKTAAGGINVFSFAAGEETYLKKDNRRRRNNIISFAAGEYIYNIIIAAASAVIGLAQPASAQNDDLFASGLPVIRIDTKDKAPILSQIDYVPMRFVLTDPNNSANNLSLAKDDFSDGGIRGRGNSSWSYPKKPYRIKFDKKQSLFGLEASKSWVLLAEYLDPTCLATPVAFHLGDIFGIDFNHSYHHVELYLNDDYVGIYGLTEQNQVGKGRVNIDEDNGWLVEMDVYYDENPKFRTGNYDLPIMIKSPEPKIEPTNINNPAFDFVIKDINELCDSMASLNFPENEYRELIDINSFINYLMINEIVGNGELGWPKSVYSYKDKNGKISMGPLWDFDWAYASGGTHTFFKNYAGYSNKHSFFKRFLNDPIFLAKYKERWNEKYNDLFDVLNFINDLSKGIEKSFASDYDRWKSGYGTDYPINYILETYKMKKWLTDRISWLNTELNKVEVLPSNKTFASQTFGYSQTIEPQKFTLVSFGDMSELSAVLKNGDLSDFEISTQLSNTQTTGGGAYLADISVKPKNSLSAAKHTDTLILMGKNQKNYFIIKAPLNFVVDKTTGTFVDCADMNKIYFSGLKLSDFILPAGYAWVAPTTDLNAGDGQIFAAAFIHPSGNYEAATGNITVNVAKAAGVFGNPAALSATYSPTLKLSDINLPTGYAWTAPTTALNTGNGQIFAATFIHSSGNYEAATGHITVNVAAASPIYDVKKFNKKYGIYVSKNPITSGIAEIKILVPEKSQINLTIYDNVGNVVFEASGIDDKFFWNLTNSAGRNVANGTYLVVAEVKGGKGTYAYSAKIGVKR